LMNPLRCVPFEKLHRFSNRKCRRYRQQSMNVIFDSANLENFHFVFSRNAT
jgi:hypothetical protein